MKNKKGFTLVELLIVITIITVMAVMMIGIINAIGVNSKARDAQRKKDLYRIKVAFEDYFSDKGYYPKDDLLVQLMDKTNCKKNIPDFPNLRPWPCDPNGNTYTIEVSTLTNKFVVLTQLENKKDKDIPAGFSLSNDFNHSKSVMTDANYGVSSSNILWYDGGILDYDKKCDPSECFIGNGPADCQAISKCDSSSDGDCYYRSINDNNCGEIACKVVCCGEGCL